MMCVALAGNRTRASRVAGENSTTEPPVHSWERRMKIVRFKHKKIQTRLKYFTCLSSLVFYSVKCPNTGSFRKPLTQNSVVDFYWLDTWTTTWTVKISIRHHQITHESIRCPTLPVWFTLFISPGKCCITVSYPYNWKRFLWYQTIILSLKPSWVPYLLGESRH